MDTLSPAERSERMALVRGKDTSPEKLVRRLVHRLGYRYGLHAADLPGKPDLVFRSRKKVIFVHGCFWHRHDNCALARLPKSRRDFWVPKLERNKSRDMESQARLKAQGWKWMIAWECQLRDQHLLERRVVAFLRGKRKNEEKLR